MKISIFDTHYNNIAELELERAIMWYEDANGTNDTEELKKLYSTPVKVKTAFLWDLYRHGVGDYYCFYAQLNEKTTPDLVCVIVGTVAGSNYTMQLLSWNRNWELGDEIPAFITAELTRRNLTLTS